MDSGGAFVQLDNLPLSDRIVIRLRNAILSGELIPGQVLVESDIASQLGVSRAPVREAIRILSAEGLVESVPYHGTRVSEVSQTDVEELYSLRSVLEQFAVQRIIQLSQPEHVKLLRELYTDMEAAAEAGDLNRVNAIDRAFHDALITLSSHQMLQHTWTVVSFRVLQVMSLRRIRRKITQRDDMKELVESHLPIIDAICDGDEGRAVDLIREHISTSGDLVAADWESGDDQDGS